jgi:hypothetical protein
MTTWYRGGNLPAGRPVWLAKSREYASFYGEPVLACALRARVLDLTALGVDYDERALLDAGVHPDAASRAPHSGELYEWAEKNAQRLRQSGVEAVAVQQWHANYSSDPEETVLVFDTRNVECLIARNALPRARRRVVAAPARKAPAELQGVRVIFAEDPHPDASYLDQAEFADRRAAYRRGEFRFVGVHAEAEIRIEETTQTLMSSGLWGIESDSEEEYLDEIVDHEWSTLRNVLKTVGVPTDQLPLEVDRTWVEWRT